MPNPMTLRALDGSNPLCFLSALGVLRLCTLQWPDSEITLHWQEMGRWTPILNGVPVDTPEQLSVALLQAPRISSDRLLSLGKNITVAPNDFALFSREAFEASHRTERSLADFCVSFGCEASVNEKGDRIQYTQFCFITGSGHQDFLGTLADLSEKVTDSHVHHALFGAINDPDKGLSFRWNPTDAKEYSLLWENPSKTGVFSTWGANLLAFEALPLYPCMPSERRLQTTGFHRARRSKGSNPSWPYFTWPIWDSLLTLDEVRSVIALASLHSLDKDVHGYSEQQRYMKQRQELEARGIVQCYRSLRVRIPPNGAQFKVSFRPSQAV